MPKKQNQAVSRIVSDHHGASRGGSYSNHRRSAAFLAKHYAKVIKLATRTRGVTRSQLSELPGFLPNQSNIQNLKNAAHPHYTITTSGKHGSTAYHFVRKLKSVKRAA